MNPWKEPPNYPKAGVEIIAELYGCKKMKLVRFVVREGEGLGNIKRWQPLPPVLQQKLLYRQD